ncbi:MAG: hypothetical protein NT150_15535 [Bacteroidetes bacterium]|nr:hypothetical protein [Bacteroidota bacterium]
MKQLKIVFSGTVLVFILCVITLMQESCSYNKIDDNKVVTNFCDTANVTYNGSVKAIIALECAYSGCHDATFAGADFNTYNGLKPYIDNGNFKTKVFTNSSMPPGGFSKAVNKDILKCWLDNGAANN